MVAQTKDIHIAVILFLIFQTIIFSQNIDKEATLVVASSAIIQKQDSTLIKKYTVLNESYLKGNVNKEILDEALDLVEKASAVNNYEIVIRTNRLIAMIFEKAENFQRAKEYYIKSLETIESANFYNDSIDSKRETYSLLYNKLLLAIGGSYQYLNKKDSALLYYNKIFNFTLLSTDYRSIKAKAYTNMAGIYIKDSKFEKAKQFSLEAIKVHRELNNKISASFALSNLASIYLEENNYKEAKSTYEEAIDLVKFESEEIAVKHLEDLYFNYAWTLYNLKDFKAYDYLESSYIIKDSIRDLSIRKAIEEIYAINNVDKVKKEEALKRVEADKKMWLIGLSSAILIIALAFVAGFYRLRQKNLGLKLSQNELLQEQKIEKLKSLSQKRILNATIDGKEAERKEIAETLHDSVSTLLSSANLHLQATRNKFNGVTPIEVEKSQQIIIEASNKIRDLSHNLVSSVLLKFGIKYAITDLVNKYSNSQINFTAAIEDLPRFNQNFEIKVHNIIQELVNNILKHSQASNASIAVAETKGWLHIEISDNGVGFKMKDLAAKDGLGINQIEARIQMMKGKFSINSVLDKGTTIAIEIPTTAAKVTTHV